MIHRRRFLKSLVGLATIPFAPLAALAPKFATGGIVQHLPELMGGCCVAGSSRPMWMQYNLGPAKWLHSHCMVYNNARKQLIPVPLEGDN